MGSDDTKPTVVEAGPASTTAADICKRERSHWVSQVVLRVILFAATLTSVIVMVTSKQEKSVVIRGSLFPIPTAKFNNSPALIYFVVALSVACLYSIISILLIFSASKKPISCTSLVLLILAISDAVMVGIVASATGSGGGVAYLGLKGNKEVRWTKICNVYDKFCRYVGGSLAVSLFAAIVLLHLSAISAFTLYKRIRSD